MRRQRRAGLEGFSLSFLDVICCGFGAIVLLLVLSKIGEPGALEQSRIDLDALIRRLQEEIFEIRGETAILNSSCRRTTRRSPDCGAICRASRASSRLPVRSPRSATSSRVGWWPPSRS